MCVCTVSAVILPRCSQVSHLYQCMDDHRKWHCNEILFWIMWVMIHLDTAGNHPEREEVRFTIRLTVLHWVLGTSIVCWYVCSRVLNAKYLFAIWDYTWKISCIGQTVLHFNLICMLSQQQTVCMEMRLCTSRILLAWLSDIQSLWVRW